jgi:hypothetical protein
MLRASWLSTASLGATDSAHRRLTGFGNVTNSSMEEKHEKARVGTVPAATEGVAGAMAGAV